MRDGTRQRREHVKSFPVRTASPTVRAIFEHMTEAGITLHSVSIGIDRHPNRISEYRRGRVEPGIMTVEELAAAAGLEIVVRPVAKTAQGD